MALGSLRLLILDLQPQRPETGLLDGEIVFGQIEEEEQLSLTSQMPLGGVIFSDGIEQDYLEFSSGVTAQIGVAEKRVNLVVDAAPGR